MGDKPIILHIISLSVIGGTKSHLCHLFEGYAHQYEIHLATGERGPLTEFAETKNIDVHILPNLMRDIDLKADFKAIQESISLIKQLRPCLIHAHTSKAGLVGRVSGYLCGVPTIYTAHGWQFAPGTPLVHKSLSYINEKLGAALSHKIICVSESDRKLALHSFLTNSRKLVTIHLGIEDSDSKMAQPEQQPPKIAMVARFAKQKDHFTLLSAISQLKHLEFSVDLVGSGPLLSDCRAMATELDIADRVNFLGNRQDIPEILSSVQLFVLSTHYEGLPISILEAMRAGLPVVASDVDGIPEEVVDGETGILVKSNNAEELAFALELLVNSPAMRKSLGEMGRQTFEHRFSLDRMLHETQSIYHQLIDSHN